MIYIVPKRNNFGLRHFMFQSENIINSAGKECYETTEILFLDGYVPSPYRSSHHKINVKAAIKVVQEVR